MTTEVLHEWTLEWVYPGKQPPNGLPPLLARERMVQVKGEGAREGELAALVDRTLKQKPPGYMLTWRFLGPVPDPAPALGLMMYRQWW
jgi:hypothetical protein